MKLFFTDPAKIDLREISFWIARENPRRALSFARELKMSCRNILEFPKAHPVVGRYQLSNLRRKVHGNYLIFYIETETQIQIIHILHGARDVEELLSSIV